MFFIVIISCSVQAQQVKWVDSNPLEVDRFIGLDSYQHTYFVKDRALYKTGELGDFVFQDFQLGAISSVDIINPLQVVVFYAEVNIVVFLDNRLNEVNRINFNLLDTFLNVGMVSNAGNNRLWLFNVDLQQLQLFDYRTNRQTIVSQPFKGQVISMASNFNDCYVLTEDTLWQINSYGSLLFEKQMEGFQKIVRNEKHVIVLKGNRLFSLSEQSLRELTYESNKNLIKDLRLTQDFLYIYDGKNISTYSLTQPKK